MIYNMVVEAPENAAQHEVSVATHQFTTAQGKLVLYPADGNALTLPHPATPTIYEPACHLENLGRPTAHHRDPHRVQDLQ
jgi:hypothetical protein